MKDAASKLNSKLVRVTGLALWLAFAVSASAQQVPDANRDDPNKQLLERINELEAKVKQLEEKQGAATILPPASSPEPTVIAQPRQSNEVSERLKFRVFGDVGYEATDRKPSSNTFEIGSLDLFMTSRLSDRVSALAEVLFIPLSDNSIGVDVERMLLQYHHNDYLTAGIGRYHSSIGYYNTAFHQGEWFQTAIGRPYMYAFDDQGGFLPLQEVGLTLNGQIPSGKLGLNYVAEMGNGRSRLVGAEPAQNSQNQNNGKSVNFALFARPSWVSGLQVGFSLYHDYLTFSDAINHSEYISTIHLVYVNSNYEFLNEAMLVRHSGSSTGGPGIFHTPAFYTQVSRRYGSYRPYFRYAYINAGVNEPIYGDLEDGEVVGRRNGPTLGLRYDLPSTPHSNYSTTAKRVVVNPVAMGWTRSLHSLFEGNRHEETQYFGSDPSRAGDPHVPEP